MRCRCSCSALLLALVVAGCGVAGRVAVDPFAYPRAHPLDVRLGATIATSPEATIRTLTFAAPDGRRIAAYIGIPTSRGRHPAVLFLHGSGGTRRDLLLPAARLALRGSVTLAISQRRDVATYRPLVVDARRALDLLDARSDVDPARIGVYGHSLGGQTAVILAGDDRRVRAVVVAAGRANDVTLYWVRRTHARLFFVGGTHDAVVPAASQRRLAAAAPGSPPVHWFPADHGLSLRAFYVAADWIAGALGLR